MLRWTYSNVEFKAPRKIYHGSEEKRLIYINLLPPHLFPDLCCNPEAINIFLLSCKKVASVLLCPRQLFQLCCKLLPGWRRECEGNTFRLVDTRQCGVYGGTCKRAVVVH
jgi:hypothetical protein